MNPMLLAALAAGAFLLLRKPARQPITEPSPDEPAPEGSTGPRRAAKDYAPAPVRGMKATPKKPGGGIVFG